jgi:hypothetical protein
MTRRNDPGLGVANRMTWTVTVTGIADTGAVQLHSPDRRQDTAVDADYVRHHLHLAYACTVHGVQGDTADHADSLLSDGTDAAAAYVALTRGRHTNTVHIVAGSIDQAREQWVAAAGRNRADLGLDQARAAATGEARNYAATTEPQPRPAQAGGKPASFADRMRQVTARLTDNPAVDDAAASPGNGWRSRRGTTASTNTRHPDPARATPVGRCNPEQAGDGMTAPITAPISTLDLDGWSRRSIWGWGRPGPQLLRELWHDHDRGDAPTIWSSTTPGMQPRPAAWSCRPRGVRGWVWC